MISAYQSEQKWGDANILLLTTNKDGIDKSEEMCLWACSPLLKLSLLLKDDSKELLDRKSFYNLYPASETQPKSQLNLICTTGARRLKLSVYMMPEAKSDTENAELSIEQEPAADIELSAEKELEDLDF